jgi:hypothetical protein
MLVTTESGLLDDDERYNTAAQVRLRAFVCFHIVLVHLSGCFDSYAGRDIQELQINHEQRREYSIVESTEWTSVDKYHGQFETGFVTLQFYS